MDQVTALATPYIALLVLSVVLLVFKVFWPRVNSGPNGTPGRAMRT